MLDLRVAGDGRFGHGGSRFDYLPSSLRMPVVIHGM
jgi:hypothetical protein